MFQLLPLIKISNLRVVPLKVSIPNATAKETKGTVSSTLKYLDVRVGTIKGQHPEGVTEIDTTIKEIVERGSSTQE